MRAILLSAAVVLALAGALMPGASENVAHAKGSPIWFTPDAGSAHEEVLVSGGMWLENTEVRLFAAFSPVMEASYPRADEFVGPFEVVTSDEEGRWEALITPGAIVGLGLPGKPGYLIVRAESDDLPLYLEGASNHFVLTVDGQRPAGSGKIEISITFESEQPRARSGGIGWRRVGSDSFHSPYIGGISLSGTLTTPMLSDGDFEVALSIPGDLEIPLGERVRLTSALMCDGLEGNPCYRANRLFVLNVSVVNAQIARVDVVLRPVAKVQPAGHQIDPLLVTAPAGDGRAAVITGASVLVAILFVGTVILGQRRARR